MGQNQPPAPGVSPVPLPSVNTPAAPIFQTIQVVQAAHIFHCNEPQLPGLDAFFGRAYERRELIQRTSIRASTAVDGEYRAGKSWLLQYVQQVAPMHPQLGTHVKVGKFSTTHPQCQTVDGFVKYALETLNLPDHNGAHGRKLQLVQLAVAVRDCKKLGIIPVLCIDEFAGLIGKPGFDITFLYELRTIAEEDGLVLITASRQPLHEIIEQMTGQSSPLFNIMPRLPLKPFTEPEARAFIDEQGQQAGFDQLERVFFLECAAIHAPDGTAGWPPLRLQLVGKMLYEDKFMALAEHRVYLVSDTTYQADFKQRLHEQYRAMVKYP
jgi:AAA domain